MLLVLASGADRIARALVERWRPADARVLAPSDLSVAGWAVDPHRPGRGTFVAEGETLDIREIRGIVGRLPAVTPAELSHVAREDRDYVAAEMTAFLTAWLAAAPFPVLNRPSAVSLLGPSWSPERWTAAAVRCGIACRTQLRRAAPGEEPVPPGAGADPATVTVAGGRWFGDVSPPVGESAARLAAYAGAELLGVAFEGRDGDARFAGAWTCPDVSAPEVADAVHERLAGAPATRAA